MRTLVVPGSAPRIVLGIAVPVALAVTVSGPARAASGTPAAMTGWGAAAAACTVSWVGLASTPSWTLAKNWSTGKVPGPSDDVCITTTGADVLTNVSITIHSLQIGMDQGIALEGTASRPLTATVAAGITMAAGGISRIDLAHASISAASINDQGGTIFTDGKCALSSPDIVFGAGGGVQAAFGTTTLTSLPQLSHGTLTGASFSTAARALSIPGLTGR